MSAGDRLTSTVSGDRAKTVRHVASDPDYADLERSVAERIAGLEGPLFTTDASGLWPAYIDNIPADRQHYRCGACKRFIEHYGGLATLDKLGIMRSAIWEVSDAGFFIRSLHALQLCVVGARVTGVFINDAEVWGTPSSGGWSHLSGTPKIPKQGTKLRTAHQIAAEKGEDYKILQQGLAEYGIDAVRQALRVLEADALARSEKTLGVTRWLMELHESIAAVTRHTRERLVWLAVATAPPGWCHIRSTMISTLLDDIKAGLDFDDIKARWARKMHPLAYQRPTAPPSDGAIKRANEIVASLEAEGALARRFARLEEVTAFWRPTGELATPEKPQDGGVFDHLKQKLDVVKEVQLPAVKMTWSRFAAEVLPKTFTLELQAPARGSYFGLVTAVNPSAPPILQWDDLNRRNPVSWFFFHGGSTAERWSLIGGAWVRVLAVCKKPPHWYEPEKHAHQGEGTLLVLEGCKLSVSMGPGGGFFPENLRSEFHEIRSVMEAYVRRAEVAGAQDGTANGYSLPKGSEHNVTLRVNGRDLYLIDRWD